jgi:hypothetical protein
LNTLAAILVRQGRWEDARAPLRDWLLLADREWQNNNSKDVIELFKECLALVRPAQLLEVIDKELLGDHWRPWVSAIEKLAGSPAPLSDEAREIFSAISAPPA